MTKPKPSRPEPSRDTGYDSFLVPRSKTPAKNDLYEKLLDLGWRFDAMRMHWHTPEGHTLQGCGALQYDPELTWARVQPPTPTDTLRIPPALITFRRVDDTWEVDA